MSHPVCYTVRMKNIKMMNKKTELIEPIFDLDGTLIFEDRDSTKLFDFKNVRAKIEKSLLGQRLDKDTKETVTLIKEMISEDKHWTIFVSKAGQIEYASTNDDGDEAYLKKLMRYESIKESKGGMLFKNN